MLFCHQFDEETPLEETIRAMEDLIRQGKILYWGTCGWSASQLYEVHSLTQRLNGYAPIVEQPLYNLFERGIEYELMPTVRSLGMGLMTWSPLAGGVLSGALQSPSALDQISEERRRWVSPWLNEESSAQVKAMAVVAQELGCTMSQLALAWSLRRREVSTVMMGVSTESQLQENLKALELNIPQNIWDQL